MKLFILFIAILFKNLKKIVQYINIFFKWISYDFACTDFRLTKKVSSQPNMDVVLFVIPVNKITQFRVSFKPLIRNKSIIMVLRTFVILSKKQRENSSCSTWVNERQSESVWSCVNSLGDGSESQIIER